MSYISNFEINLNYCKNIYIYTYKDTMRLCISNKKTDTCLTLFNSKRHNKYALKEHTLRISFAMGLITIYVI